MSEMKKLSKEQLNKVSGGTSSIKYICDVCSNEIPAEAEQKIDYIQTNLNDPTSLSAVILKKCPHCNEFVRYHAVFN